MSCPRARKIPTATASQQRCGCGEGRLKAADRRGGEVNICDWAWKFSCAVLLIELPFPVAVAETWLSAETSWRKVLQYRVACSASSEVFDAVEMPESRHLYQPEWW